MAQQGCCVVPVAAAFWAVSLAAPRGWLLCLCEPGAGSLRKATYRTRDGGSTWQRAGSVGLSGYARGVSFAAYGAGLLWEGRGTLYLTLDGGSPLAVRCLPSRGRRSTSQASG